MAGANTTGDGELLVLSKTGTPLVTAGPPPMTPASNSKATIKTGESVVQIFADDYGNGVVGATIAKARAGR